APAVGADRQERLADRPRIVRPEAGKGCSRDLAAALFDHPDHDYVAARGAELRRQFIEHQPVEVGAVAEGRVEFQAQPFGPFGMIAHSAAFPMKSCGIAATSAFPVADCGAATRVAADPVSTMRP